jgi:hypothetical protein
LRAAASPTGVGVEYSSLTGDESSAIGHELLPPFSLVRRFVGARRGVRIHHNHLCS